MASPRDDANALGVPYSITANSEEHDPPWADQLLAALRTLNILDLANPAGNTHSSTMKLPEEVAIAMILQICPNIDIWDVDAPGDEYYHCTKVHRAASNAPKRQQDPRRESSRSSRLARARRTEQVRAKQDFDMRFEYSLADLQPVLGLPNLTWLQGFTLDCAFSANQCFPLQSTLGTLELYDAWANAESLEWLLQGCPKLKYLAIAWAQEPRRRDWSSHDYDRFGEVLQTHCTSLPSLKLRQDVMSLDDNSPLAALCPLTAESDYDFNVSPVLLRSLEVLRSLSISLRLLLGQKEMTSTGKEFEGKPLSDCVPFPIQTLDLQDSHDSRDDSDNDDELGIRCRDTWLGQLLLDRRFSNLQTVRLHWGEAFTNINALSTWQQCRLQVADAERSRRHHTLLRPDRLYTP